MKKNNLMKQLRMFSMRSRKLFSTVLLLAGGSISIFSQPAKPGYTKIISLKLNNVQPIKALNEINRLGGDCIAFKNEEVEKEKKRVTLDLKNVTVLNAVEECLKETLLTSVVQRENILIIPQQTGDRQKYIIRGKVTDTKGEPLAGVTVLIKGTQTGMSTDAKGQFVLTIPHSKDIVLVFSFVGMEKKELKLADIKDEKILNGEKEYTVMLAETAKVLEDVIVTGYFNINRSTYSGNVTQVKKEELLRVDSRNILNALQYFEPSLRMKENNTFGSDPNSLPQFTLRGESSILDNSLESEHAKLTQRTDMFAHNPNLPVFILDGFEVTVQTIYDLDINRVETVSILKDANATALYGSRAANGVIVITTVPPKPGNLDIDYAFGMTTTLPDLSDYNMANAAEKLEIERLSGLYTGKTPSEQAQKDIDYNTLKNEIQRGVNTDWMALPLRNAYATTHRFTLQGGVQSLRYMIGVNANGTPGVMKGSHRNKYGGDLTVYYNYGKFRLNNAISYNNTRAEDSPYGVFSDYVKQLPYREVYDEDGEYLKYFKGGISRNPLWKTTTRSYSNRDYINDIQNKFIAFYFPVPNIEIKGQIGLKKLDRKVESFEDPALLEYTAYAAIDKGELRQSFTNSSRWETLFQIRYFPDFGLHHFSISGAFEASNQKTEGMQMTYRGFQLGQFFSPAFAARQTGKTLVSTSQVRSIGYKGILNYTYDNIAYVNGNINLEGNSQFGSDRRHSSYWSLGAGINLQNISWLRINREFLSELRLRGSYGITGTVGFNPYAAVTTYQIDPQDWYYMGPAAAITYLGNPELKGQKVYINDIGMEANLWHGRFILGINYYRKKTVDMIDNVPIQTSSGFAEFQANGGSLLNRGWEFTLSVVPLQTKDWRIFVSANLVSNKDKILKLGAAAKRYNELILQNYNDKTAKYNKYDTLAIKPLIQLYEGVSQHALWAVRSAGIDPANGKEKFIKRNGTSTYTWHAEDMVEVGNTEPSANGSFSVNVAYKGFYMQSTFAYEWGRSIYNETLLLKVEEANIQSSNVDKRVLTQRWKKPGDIAPFLDIKSSGVVARTRPSTRFVQKENILELGGLTMGYNFNREVISKWGLRSLDISFNATSIFRLSTIKMERGTNYPYAHNYNFNLRIGF